MDFATILKYLEQGFTLEQIEQMKILNEKNSAQTGAGDITTPNNDDKSSVSIDVSKPNETKDDPAPVWADSLSKTIEKLTMTIQAQALSNSSIPAPKDIQSQADDILASIINPTFKKE